MPNPIEFIRRLGGNDWRTVGNQVVLSDPNGEVLSIDEHTNTLVTVDWAHGKVHEGDTYSVSYKSPNASPIADDGTINFALQTNTARPHLIAGGACGGDFEAEIMEGAAFNGGTVMTAYNRNRSSVNVTAVIVTRDVTITNSGTLIFNKYIPGGGGLAVQGNAGGTIQGISDEARDEWMLAANTIYIIRITNRAGGAQQMSLAVEWYE